MRGLLLGSIVCNYAFGLWIANAEVRHDAGRKKQQLVVAATANLLLLGYNKYANFFVGSFNSVVGTQWELGEIILPQGISFFTFTHICHTKHFIGASFECRVESLPRAWRRVR